MRLQPRISDILKFGKHRTPGFGINKGYYLSVLAARAPMPLLLDVVAPKGEGGAVAGFGVPLSKGATKDHLRLPMERGAYAIAAPDQKTVLRLLVMSKEEANFSPPACVGSVKALHFDEEVRCRLLSTWSIAQITFESHHPMVYPAVAFALRVANRLAELTYGLVADPVSRAYRLPGEVPSPQTNDEYLDVRDVVQVKTVEGDGGPWAFTLGMQKFDLPEFALQGFHPGLAMVATDLLYGIAQAGVSGERLQLGDSVGSTAAPLVLAPGANPCCAQGVLCHRLVPTGGALDASLRAWVSEVDEQASGV